MHTTTQAGVEAERTLDDLSIANEQLRVDIEKWKDAKDGEIASLMTTFADNHINHHRKVGMQWTPSNPATLGTCQSVLVGGVASFQGWICTTVNSL